MSQGAKSPYGKYGVYGSPVYDFRPVGNEKAGDYGRSEESGKKCSVKQRRHRSPASAVAAILCVALLFAGLMAQSDLVAISDEAYTLRQEIVELSRQQRELKIQHATAFPLSDTEEYAIDVLGMQKASVGQIKTVDLPESLPQQSTDTIELK